MLSQSLVRFVPFGAGVDAVVDGGGGVTMSNGELLFRALVVGCGVIFIGWVTEWDWPWVMVAFCVMGARALAWEE
jgi:hypothetical protein